MSWKYANITKLLTTVSLLLVCDVSLQAHSHSVKYKDILKSRVGEIQTDIIQIYNGGASILKCDHYPVFTGDSTTIVIFLWASEEETHAMRNCLYQGIKRAKMKTIRMLQSSNFSQEFIPDVTVKFCNKSVTSGVMTGVTSRGKEINNETRVIALTFNAIDPQ